jgi:hypothetical protein
MACNLREARTNREDRSSGVGSFEQVVEAADSEPPIAVRLEEDRVAAAGIGMAVVVGEKIDEQAVLFAIVG